MIKIALVCNICERKAKYRVNISDDRFTTKLYYCEEHKPNRINMGEMDEKQGDWNINTILESSVTNSQDEQKDKD